MKKSEFFISLILITILILFSYILLKNNNYKITPYNIDTVYVNKFFFDTITKWQDRIVYKKIEPEKIRIIKSDSLVIPEEVILSTESKDDLLKVISFNLNDSIFKEYIIPEIYSDFRITSIGSNLSFKTKKFQFNGINLYTGLEYNFKNTKEKMNYIFGIETGIKYKKNYEISFDVQYNKGLDNIYGAIKFKYKL